MNRQAFSGIFLFIYLLLFMCERLLYLCPMVDEKKLKTVRNYAKKKGFHRNWIYQLIHKKEVETVVIDGVTFVRDEKS